MNQKIIKKIKYLSILFMVLAGILFLGACREPNPTDLIVRTNQERVEILEGENLDKANFAFFGVYKDGKEKEIDKDLVRVVGFDSNLIFKDNNPIKQTLTFSYLNLKVNFEIYIIPRLLQRIDVFSGEGKTRYIINEEIDLENIIILLTYPNGDFEEVPLALEHIDNLNELNLDNGKLTKAGNYELVIKYRGQPASNNFRISVEKYSHEEETFTVLSNESVLDLNEEYQLDHIPHVSKIEVSSLKNGKYKIVESFEGQVADGAVESAIWQDSNIFLNLKPNQEYRIIGMQGASDTYKEGKTYTLQEVTTPALISPTPVVLTYGYNFIEVAKEKYVNYQLNRYSEVVELANTIRFNKLNPNEEYQVTAKYAFNDPRNDIISSNVNQKIRHVDNPFETFTNQEHIYNNEPFKYNTKLKSEFSNAGNIITEITYNDELEIPTNVGTYQVKIRHRFSPSQLIAGTLTIKKKNISLKVDDKVKDYFDLDPNFTYTILDELPEGDNASIFNHVFRRSNGELIGSYQINLQIEHPNYNFIVTPGTLKINKKVIYAVSNDEEKEYGRALGTPTYEFLEGEPEFHPNHDKTFIPRINYTTTGIDSNPSFDSGIYYDEINYSLENSSYEVIFVNKGSVIIKPYQIGVTIHAKSKIYGESDPNLTYYLSNESYRNQLDLQLSREAGDSVGTYNISVRRYNALNFSLDITTNQFEIKKADLTFEVNDLTITYGQDYRNQASLSLIEGLLVNSDSLNDFSITYDELPNQNHGTYQIGANITNDNYNINVNKGTLTVDKKIVKVTPSYYQEKIYGDLDPIFNYTLAGVVNDDVVNVNLGRSTGEDVGLYEFVLNEATNENYTLQLESRTFRIKKRTSIVTPLVVSKTYGDLEPTITYSLSNLVSEEDKNNITGLLSRNIGEDVGSYPIKIGTLKLDNYDLLLSATNFEINPKSITIDYGLESSYTYGDLVNLNNATSELLPGEYINLLGYNHQVGIHLLRPVIKNDSNKIVTSNYQINNPTVNLIINKATLFVNPINTTKVFGQNNSTIRYEITSGLKYGDSKSVLSGNLTRVDGEDAGSYEILATNLVANNYQVSLTSNQFTITAKPIMVNYQTNYTYNQAEQEVIILNEDSSFITATVLGNTFKNSGNYQVLFSSTNSNYQISNEEGSVTINKQLVTINIDNKNKTFGEENPEFTADLTPLDNLDEAFDPSVLVFATDALIESPHGSYDITITSGFTSNNYHFEYVEGRLTISSADYTVEITDTYTYDGTAHPLFVKLIDTNGIDVTDDYVITIIYPQGVAPSNAGVYSVSLTIDDSVEPITTTETLEIKKRPLEIDYHIGNTHVYGDPYNKLQATASNLVDNHFILLTRENLPNLGEVTLSAKILNENNQDVTNNYQIDKPSHTFEVVKALLTVYPTITSKVFGDNDPAVLSYYAEGYRNNETSAVISGNLIREAGEEVGTYLFLVDSLVAEKYNFVIADNYQEFTITKRPITIDYNLPATITYGDEVVENANGNNLRVGDTVKINGRGTEVSNYELGVSVFNETNEEITNNYLISNPTFNFTVNQKELIITPNQLSKTYGDDDPSDFTYQVSGYVYDESNLISGKLSRVAGEIAGTYQIEIGNLAVNSSNYYLTLIDENFIINEKNISFNFEEEEYVYHSDNQVINLLSNDLVSGDLIVITSEQVINAGEYQLAIKIMKEDIDVTTSYIIDNESLMVTIKPKEINEVDWSYDNQVVTASSDDLELVDQFSYENHNNLTPGIHIAKITASDNYIFTNEIDQSYEYIHYGDIEEQLIAQTSTYSKVEQKYDISYLIASGYEVTEKINNNQIDASEYSVTLILKKQYYYEKELTTTFTILPKPVVAVYNYLENYNFTDTNYLNNNLVSLGDELPPSDYQIENYRVLNGISTTTSQFRYVGTYRISYVIYNTNYIASENNDFILTIHQPDLKVLVQNQLLIEGSEYETPNFHTIFEKNLEVSYHTADIELADTSIPGLETGQKVVTITKVLLNGLDVTDQFNIISETYLYTIISKDYIKLLDYNKDDLDREEGNEFSNGLMEATKNPTIGFGYRYHNVYYANKYIMGELNSSYDSFNSSYYYKYGNLNDAVIYLGNLINIDSLEIENVLVEGLGIINKGLKILDFTTDDIHSGAQVVQHGLVLKFNQLGKQTITISYSKYGQKIELAKLNIEVIDGFTNITTYEELFNSSNETIQNIILNNGIVYKQTLGVTINVNNGKTLYGNNYEINSYSASYSDNDKPASGGKKLIYTTGTLDNVRVIQRRVTVYASAGEGTTSINSDTAVQFEGGEIRNSFIANGRETIEIASTVADLVIENTTVLGGPFGIRRRTGGKLTLINTKIIQRPDIDFIAQSQTNDGGMGIPVVFLNNQGFDIKELAKDIELVVSGNTKFYGFETLENLKNATLPVGVKQMVGNIIQELWDEFQDQLLYERRIDGLEQVELVMSPSVLFVSPEDIKADFEARNPISGYAKVFQHAYKSIAGLASGYGYVYTYNHLDKLTDGSQRYSQTVIENEGLLTPPSYNQFHGEYKGD